MEKLQHLKEDNLKRLHTVWFQLASILGKVKTMDIIFLKETSNCEVGGMWIVNVGDSCRAEEAAHSGFSGSWKYLYDMSFWF